MKLQNAELRDILAAEYIMGNLHGRARQRFEYYMTTLPALRSTVEYWSEKLQGLNDAMIPISPRANNWKYIERRLGFNKQQNWILSLMNTLSFWRLSSALTAGFAVLMMSYIVFSPSIETVTATQYVTVINNQQAQSSWLISVNLETKNMQIKTVVAQNIQSNQSFELWLLPDAKKAPISMGLIPATGKRDIKLNPQLLALLKQNLSAAVGMAVSLEPKGGSTTGAPTGPILYQGKIDII